MFDRLPSGEIARITAPEVGAGYERLRAVHDLAVGGSGAHWNWPSALTLTAVSLSRILHLDDLYRRIIDVPGIVCEFGTHWGTSAAILRNLRTIHEPRNRSRELHLFDTWSGFTGASEADHGARDGDFGLPPGWEETLRETLEAQDAANEVPSPPSVVLHRGDARETFAAFLREDPGKVIALASLDMDLYAPTRDVLELLAERLVVGSIVVFDELNYPPHPGETRAFLESNLRWSRLTRSRFMPYAAFTVVESRV